jgi:hypothetical protein
MAISDKNCPDATGNSFMSLSNTDPSDEYSNKAINISTSIDSSAHLSQMNSVTSQGNFSYASVVKGKFNSLDRSPGSYVLDRFAPSPGSSRSDVPLSRSVIKHNASLSGSFVNTSLQNQNGSAKQFSSALVFSNDEPRPDLSISRHVEGLSLVGSHLNSFRTSLIPSKDRLVLDMVKLAYAEYLNGLGLLEKRAEVLKFAWASLGSHWNNIPLAFSRTRNVLPMFLYLQILNFSFFLDCQQDFAAKKPFIKCSICRLTCKGLTSFCNLCGHGGHLEHMQNWFKSESICPTGCGCMCIIKSSA